MELKTVGESPLNPSSSVWSEVSKEVIKLKPVPVDAQPNQYIRNAYKDTPYGNVGEVSLSVAEHDNQVFVRLEWDDSNEPNIEFQDAAGVFFPESGSSESPETIGTKSNPVRLWMWKNRTELQSGLSNSTDLISSGPGVFHPVEGSQSVNAEANLSNGKWSVVISGGKNIVEGSRKLGIVVWDGSNNERAGIGAVSSNWIEI